MYEGASLPKQEQTSGAATHELGKTEAEQLGQNFDAPTSLTTAVDSRVGLRLTPEQQNAEGAFQALLKYTGDKEKNGAKGTSAVCDRRIAAGVPSVHSVQARVGGNLAPYSTQVLCECRG